MSTLTVKNIQGVSPTNQITVPAGHRIIAPAGGLVAPGHVMQVQQTTKTDAWTGSVASGSATYATVTGLSVSITPQYTSSKILVMANLWVGYQQYSLRGVVRRDGTHLLVGDAASSRPRCSFWLSAYVGNTTYEGYHLHQVAFNYLDSPSSTSALSYDVGLASYGGSIVTLNRNYNWQNSTEYDGAVASSITVMEIGQ
jgi:hypothetical protein